MILSVAMMLEYTASAVTGAAKIETAVEAALNAGNATRDIGGTLGTDTMADAVIEQFPALECWVEPSPGNDTTIITFTLA